jgi:hypothetical protein
VRASLTNSKFQFGFERYLFQAQTRPDHHLDFSRVVHAVEIVNALQAQTSIPNLLDIGAGLQTFGFG